MAGERRQLTPRAEAEVQVIQDDRRVQVSHRRPADARFAMHHRHAAVPAAGAGEQPVEHLTLALPADQPPS
jgi:hypothetical protein